MIQEAYVSYQTAMLLKEKGFDEKCTRYYDSTYNIGSRTLYYGCQFITNREIKDAEECTAPTQQMAMRWLREVHKLHITVVFHINDCNLWQPTIFTFNGYHNIIVTNKSGGWYNTYEEACEAAINYCLEKII